MTKKLAKKIADLWNANFAGSTPATRTKAIVYEIRGSYSVEIHPDGEESNEEAFFNVENLADIARTFKMNCFITYYKHTYAVIH